jgi:hypothetical protein
MQNHHTMITSDQFLSIKNSEFECDRYLFKLEREREIKPLINKWLQLNSNKNLQHILKRIVKLCISTEHYRIKMSVCHNCRNIGSLYIYYDGSLTYKNTQNNNKSRNYFQPYMTHNTFMGTKFKWLPDVISWADCDKITPIEGARYINNGNNTMASLNIYEYYQGKWIKTIPEKGLLVYRTEGKVSSYYDGSTWNGCFNI